MTFIKKKSFMLTLYLIYGIIAGLVFISLFIGFQAKQFSKTNDDSLILLISGLAIGMLLGLPVGFIAGLLIDSIEIGIALGPGVGIILGLISGKRFQNKYKKTNATLPLKSKKQIGKIIFSSMIGLSILLLMYLILLIIKQ